MPVPLPEGAPRAPAPPGPERQLRCCTASGCRSAGGEALLAALQAAAAAGGDDAPAIRPVGCLRLCGRGPLLACDGPEGTRLYGGVPPELASALLATARGEHRQAEGRLSADAVAACRIDLEHPFFRLQRPVVLESCGLVDPESIADAIAHGAYSQLRRVLESFTPQQVRDEVRRSGLRGRGGAGYPTGLK
ncbi:MAG: hypothetical protein VKO65_03035, partial [Cyanobacteriota bacterium]|nr:hypothetical protein [Cyanobacteriota bacterium]